MGQLVPIVAACIIASVGAAISLYIYYDRRKPALEVKVTKKEPYFEKRIEVHNRNHTAYVYRIKVGGRYLNWQKNETEGKTHDKTRIMLAENFGSGVILDPVLEKLQEHEIKIECHGWQPLPKIVYRRLYERM